MKLQRIGHFCFAVVLGLSLFFTSFAAPLCACLSAAAKSADCCEKMKHDCPEMAGGVVSLGSTSHLHCECSVEQQGTLPTKLSENSKSQQTAAALMPAAPQLELSTGLISRPSFFIRQISYVHHPHKQTSARAPPGL
jgi:hypothetical protein